LATQHIRQPRLSARVLVRRCHGNALFHDLRDILTGRDQLKDTPVNFPVTELLSPEGIVTEVSDMEAVV
jgi:hypothetical protein